MSAIYLPFVGVIFQKIIVHPTVFIYHVLFSHEQKNRQAPFGIRHKIGKCLWGIHRRHFPCLFPLLGRSINYAPKLTSPSVILRNRAYVAFSTHARDTLLFLHFFNFLVPSARFFEKIIDPIDHLVRIGQVTVQEQ